MDQREFVAVAVTADGRRVPVRIGAADGALGVLSRVARWLRSLFAGPAH
ncbi:hypothetical protein BH23CHL6_BH23CHL6_08950 [soil metagenome]|jgi:hypothetical protein